MNIVPSVVTLLGLLVSSGALAVAPVAPVDSNGLAQAQQHLVQREYFASHNDAGLQAPNRAQGFRTYFDRDGIRLVTRDARSAPLVRITLAGIGRGKSVVPLNPTRQMVNTGAEVTQRWSNVEVRYANTTDGLTQHFVLQKPAAGAGETLLALNIDQAAAEIQGDELVLRNAGNTVRLSALAAHDAGGRALPLAMALKDDQVQWAIDDQSARYPIVVKTLLTGTFDVFLEQNQTNAFLGTSVASAGDVNGDGFADVIVGAPSYDSGQTDEGAAFVYFGGAGGMNASADARLESNQTNAQLGVSVAAAGDVNGDGFADVIVGAPNFDNGETDEGAALIYFGSIGAFDPNVDAQLEANQGSAFFGNRVASAGDVNGDGFADVIVGAPNFSNGQIREGAAFVYFGGAGGFNLAADAQLEFDQADANLGWSVAGAGDVNGDGFADVIVGARGYDNGQSNEGMALVYFGAAGAFNTTNDALMESNQVNAQLGTAVAGAGDVNGDGFADVIVGAGTYSSGQANEGAAFVYFGGSGAFNVTADAQLEANQINAFFGGNLAAAGDVNGDGFGDILIAANGYDNGQFEEGAVFVYFGGIGAFDSTVDAQLESNQAGAAMGTGVAGAGDVNGDGFADVIVGAPIYVNGQTSEGAAFVYFGGAGAFSAAHDAQLESGQVNAQLGFSVAGAGDVNGDGFADVIVGARLYDTGQTDEGAAFVFFGGAGNFNLAFDALLRPNQASAFFGSAVAGAGDVNADGFADVIVGAPNLDSGQADEGAAFVYFGGAGAFDVVADARLEANQVSAGLGNSVAAAGDVNGDEFADVIVGAFGFDNGESNEGAAFVYFGRAGVFDPIADTRMESNQINAQLGYSVAGAGDVNGDGFADVIVGANSFNNGENNEGAAFVYFGGGVFNNVADALLQSNQVGAQLGFSVAGAGDVNGDGFADVIVGAPLFDNSRIDAGAVFTYLGGSGAFNANADAELSSDQAGAQLGFSVAGAGDVNGDGFADLLVGVPNYNFPELGEGVAVVYYGSATFDFSLSSGPLQSDQAGAKLGFSVAGAGDVNGDGFADVIVGAPNHDNGQNDEGAAFVYYGTARGRLVQSGQFRSNGTPVQAWGYSQQADGFVVAMNATSPRGRERARLQVEACPAAAPFGSLLCDLRSASSWTELGANANGAELVLPITGLNLNRLYHWRARVQYAPMYTTAMVNPSAGPWRRLNGNADTADIRTQVTDVIFANGFQ